MIQFDERPWSRNSTENPRTVTLLYVLNGIADWAAARAYAIASTPLMFGGLFRQDVKLDRQGPHLWYVDVPYGAAEGTPSEWDVKWSFDTTGGTARIDQAKEHIADYGEGGNHEGAIGVAEKGDIEGTEIVIPSFRWTETWMLPVAFASFGYSDVLEALTATVNLYAFRGKPPGAVRFDGAQGSGSLRDPDLVELTYHFTRGVKIDHGSIGPFTGVNKDAWEYAWTEFNRAEDLEKYRGVTKPIGLHIERVYDFADFALLGIGTGSLL